jgi:hypothetical protein
VAEQHISFAEPLDFAQIVFRQINSCRESRKIPSDFYKNVESLSDILFPYWDKMFKKVLENNKMKPDLSNPFFSQATDEKKEDYARLLFRELIALIHRSGFLPRKEVEGVISEYDGKLLEKLMDLERQGVTDIEDKTII